MKTIVDIEQANELLQQFIGGRAQVYMFNVSLKRLCIKVESFKLIDVVYIVLAGCKFIRGHFEWSSADMMIEVEYANEYESITKIIDKNADLFFYAESAALSQRGLASDSAVNRRPFRCR